jgi:hypothetical protein
MDNGRVFWRKWALLICSGLGIIVAALLSVRANAQIQSTGILAERLRNQGVPVKAVEIVNGEPGEVEIILQSTSAGSEFAPEDLWYAQLARREASLAHRIGILLDGYTLTQINMRGEILSSGYHNIASDDPSQQSVASALPQLDDEATGVLIGEELELYGLSIASLDVTSGVQPDVGQRLIMLLSVPDLEAANQAIPAVLPPISYYLDNINSEHDTNVVICWIRIQDQQGNLLVNYIVDLETGTETWSKADDILAWYPSPPVQASEAPMPDEMLPEATSVPFGYP